MNLPYTHVQDVVAEMRAKHFPGFYVLPYNRFDIDHSQHWWLSPTADKAAFRFAKAVFTTDEGLVDPGAVFCGLNVEKGLEADDGGNPNNQMKPNWFWKRFLGLAGHPMASLIEQARAAVGADLQLYVSTGCLVPNAVWSRVLFDISGTDLGRRSYKPGDGTLADIAACTDLSQFAAAIHSIDGAATAWQWADILIGRPFTMDPSGPDDLGTCAEMLKPFEPWMRTT